MSHRYKSVSGKKEAGNNRMDSNGHMEHLSKEAFEARKWDATARYSGRRKYKASEPECSLISRRKFKEAKIIYTYWKKELKKIRRKNVSRIIPKLWWKPSGGSWAEGWQEQPRTLKNHCVSTM